ncbi:MAG: single-stranded DNA-binding protein [Sandaracinaceae bacterium]|nr:single-stranded DNA-binding protein [Sandaracinaceae bacterium]
MPTTLKSITKKLAGQLDTLTFGAPVAHVYNPLVYAWAPHERYLGLYGRGPKRVVLVGMNPGPFGMGQTGVPFGDVGFARDWLGVAAEVGSPPNPHPKRMVDGFGCTRREVSGTRLWGWAAERFGTAERFFEEFFVVNYCPLLFMEESGRNRTPDKLPAAERAPLEALCDDALAQMVALLRPEWVVGVGQWARMSAERALAGTDVRVGQLLHPSPASPAANRGWAPQAEAQLRELGIL